MSEFFEEYTHIVADSTKPWPYFDIPGRLKILSWSVDECYGRIYPQWITKSGLARHAVVQLALYTCDPFRDAPPVPYPRRSQTEDFIIDQSTLKNNDKKQRKYLCPSVISLVEALATALMHYESWCEYVYRWPKFQEQQAACLAFLRAVQDLKSRVRHRGFKLKDPTLKHRRTLDAQIEDVINIVTAIRYQDYQHAGAATDTPSHPRAHGNKWGLLNDMHQAFSTYKPEKWSKAATYRALAAIMNQMKITNAEGEDWKPDAIKKLLKRGPDPNLALTIHLTHPNVVPWYTRPE